MIIMKGSSDEEKYNIGGGWWKKILIHTKHFDVVFLQEKSRLKEPEIVWQLKVLLPNNIWRNVLLVFRGKGYLIAW